MVMLWIVLIVMLSRGSRRITNLKGNRGMMVAQIKERRLVFVAEAAEVYILTFLSIHQQELSLSKFHFNACGILQNT